MESTVLSDVILQMTRPVCGHGVSGSVILSCYFTDDSTSVRTWCFWICHSVLLFYRLLDQCADMVFLDLSFCPVILQITRPVCGHGVSGPVILPWHGSHGRRHSEENLLESLGEEEFPVVTQDLYQWWLRWKDSFQSWYRICIHWHSAFIDTLHSLTLHSLTLCIHWHSAFIDTLHSLTLCIHWHSAFIDTLHSLTLRWADNVLLGSDILYNETCIMLMSPQDRYPFITGDSTWGR